MKITSPLMVTSPVLTAKPRPYTERFGMAQPADKADIPRPLGRSNRIVSFLALILSLGTAGGLGTMQYQNQQALRTLQAENTELRQRDTEQKLALDAMQQQSATLQAQDVRVSQKALDATLSISRTFPSRALLLPGDKPPSHFGSGIILLDRHNQPVLLSNHHVTTKTDEGYDPPLESKEPLKIKLSDGTEFETEIQDYSHQNFGDMALLKLPNDPKIVDNLRKRALPVRFTPRHPIIQGETLYIAGNPIGAKWSVTKGLVSAIRPDGYLGDKHVYKGPFIQTNAALNPGNSGGPALDKDGQLVGMSVQTVNINVAQSIGMIIHGDNLLAFLESRGVDMVAPTDKAVVDSDGFKVREQEAAWKLVRHDLLTKMLMESVPEKAREALDKKGYTMEYVAKDLDEGVRQWLATQKIDVNTLTDTQKSALQPVLLADVARYYQEKLGHPMPQEK
jgi:S1-C subfamily serine protease